MIIDITVETGFAGATHEDEYEIPDEEWEAMDEEEQRDFLDDLATLTRNERIECYAFPRS